MQDRHHLPIEEMEVFRHFIEIADWTWEVVSVWEPFARNTIGEQLVRAADSVGANLVEGDGRHGAADSLRFFVIARASARETRYWLRRAMARKLISAEVAQQRINDLETAAKLLNRLIAYRREHSRADRVAEFPALYECNEPSVQEDPLAARDTSVPSVLEPPPSQHLTPNT